MAKHSKALAAPRRPVNLPVPRAKVIEYDRITHCPETGIDLDLVDIKKHVLDLWPNIDDRNRAYDEALRRRDHLMHEYEARQTEAGMSHGNRD